MEELVNSKNKCCGCGLCAIKCPKHAITIKEDEYGFKYPYIDKDKCINCGICKKVCEYNKKTNNNKDYITKAYVAISKNNSILNTTASGGVFTSVATSFLKNGGIVFGCSLEKDSNSKFIIRHIKVSSIVDLDKLKGSKYVQSDISSCLNEIKNELLNGKKVLFSGTPCQVAAVKAYTKDSDNLFTIDIICHGVPSNRMFNDYIEFLNKKNNIQIENFKFRDKKKGWGLYYCYYYYDKSKNKYVQKALPAFKSSYYQLFLDSYTYRENCYSCPYANEKRISDLTIGDYWGIDIEHPELINNNQVNPEKGVSCIIVNSSKGNKLINEYCNNIQLYDSQIDKVKIHNHQLNRPSKYQQGRQLLLDNYKNNGYQAIEKYFKKKNKVKNRIKSIWYRLPYKLRKKLKK